jgi:predicted glycoside hydrolase/deacetylase ChbG (UPF0249 family)
MGQRRLIVNADDFGLTEGVNRGIVEAYKHGILRSATLMANGHAFEDAVEQAGRCPGLDVGCHLVLIGGHAVAPPHGPLPASVPQLLRRLASGWRAAGIEREFSAQIESILASGIRPTHLDTHKHTHVAPPVLLALLRVAQRYAIPWIRRPFDLPSRAARGSAGWQARIVQSGLRPLRRRFESFLKTNGCRCTDHFAGFQLTGRFHSRQLADLIQALPEGLTEFMCHPGRWTPELAALPTRLTTSREAELEALVSEEVRCAVEASGTELVSFRDLE